MGRIHHNRMQFKQGALLVAALLVGGSVSPIRACAQTKGDAEGDPKALITALAKEHGIDEETVIRRIRAGLERQHHPVLTPEERREHARRNSLDRRIERFKLRNGSIESTTRILRELGVMVCFEELVQPSLSDDWYIDGDGVGAFMSRSSPIAIDLTGATVREILDKIVEIDPRYVWSQDAKRGVIVFSPREGTRLGFRVEPVTFSGRPWELMIQLYRKTGREAFSPTVMVGADNIPFVDLRTSTLTANELLNEVVAQHPGMTWSFGGRVWFGYMRKTTAEAVDIELPPLTKGVPTNTSLRYEFLERDVNGIITLMAEKRPTNPK